MCLAENGSIVMAGQTTSHDFPVTPDAYLQTFPAAQYRSGFVARMSAEAGQ